jgi:hypothetical protein
VAAAAPGGEPAFLVAPLDFPLGLGVEGVAVLLGDAEGGQQVLEGVPAAAETGGVDAPVNPGTSERGRSEAGHLRKLTSAVGSVQVERLFFYCRRFVSRT